LAPGVQPRDKVIDIALDAGFQNAESFSRAFRTAFAKARASSVNSRTGRVASTRTETYATGATSMDVKIFQFPTTRIAVLQHRGSPDLSMPPPRVYRLA
jgi:AraC family transcriptional regulator